jgi:hypothetical protein
LDANSAPLEGNAARLVADCRVLPLVLFTGAGIMAPADKDSDWLIPQWCDLVTELLCRGLRFRVPELRKKPLLEMVLAVIDRDMDVYGQASLAKALLGEAYLPELRALLYAQGSTPGHGCVGDAAKSRRRYPFFWSVVDLCDCSSAGVSALVTYNYDDFLESRVTQRRAYSVSGPREDSLGTAPDALPVFHVHGHLPPSGRAPDPDDAVVVLAVDEYLDNMAQPYSWQTTTQLHFLRSAVCLFLGVSMTDVNMLRVLRHARQYCRRQHTYALVPAPGGLATPAECILLQLKASLLEDLGVRLIAAPDFATVPQVVDRLRDALVARRMEAND